MKATQIYIIIMSMAALAFTSCVKEELHDTPHPETGKIAVTADWARRRPNRRLLRTPSRLSLPLMRSSPQPKRSAP